MEKVKHCEYFPDALYGDVVFWVLCTFWLQFLQAHVWYYWENTASSAVSFKLAFRNYNSPEKHFTETSHPPQILWWSSSQKFRLPLQACFLSFVLLLLSLTLFLSLSLWQSFKSELIYDTVFLCMNNRQTQWEIIIWGKYCWIAVGGQGSQKVILQPQTEKTSGESHSNLTASSLVSFFSPHLPASLHKEPFGLSVCKPSSVPHPPADDFALISQ